jgi:hypothetical protein
VESLRGQIVQTFEAKLENKVDVGEVQQALKRLTESFNRKFQEIE